MEKRKRFECIFSPKIHKFSINVGHFVCRSFAGKFSTTEKWIEFETLLHFPRAYLIKYKERGEDTELTALQFLERRSLKLTQNESKIFAVG